MIKEILRIFGVASSLITNLNKCSLTPIQCEDQDLTVAQNFLPCSVVNFPYRGFLLLLRNSLGVLLWILWIRYQLPAWKAAELHPAGRVALVKSVLTAIRIYHLIALHCPKWVFKAIDKVRRGFVWKGRTNINGGHCSVAWTRVCRPLSLGGLGIHNLETLGWALNMQWLWLKKTQPDGPWSEFDIKTHTNAAALFASSVCSIIGNGATTLFWSDRWLYGICVASSSISNMTYPWKSSEKKNSSGSHVGQQMGPRYFWQSTSTGYFGISHSLGFNPRSSTPTWGPGSASLAVHTFWGVHCTLQNLHMIAFSLGQSPSSLPKGFGRARHLRVANSSYGWPLSIDAGLQIV